MTTMEEKLRGLGVAKVNEYHANRRNVEALEKKVLSLSRIVAHYHAGRCYACGWPLKPTAEQGCVPGNCSYRPSEEHQSYKGWIERQHEVTECLK